MAKKRKWNQISHHVPQTSYGNVSKDQFLATITRDVPAKVPTTLISQSQNRHFHKAGTGQSTGPHANSLLSRHAVPEERSSLSIRPRVQASKQESNGQLSEAESSQEMFGSNGMIHRKQWRSESKDPNRSGTENLSIRRSKTTMAAVASDTVESPLEKMKSGLEQRLSETPTNKKSMLVV